MRSRCYRRYIAEKIAFKRWRFFHRMSNTEFSRAVFPFLSARLGRWWAQPPGRYRKWNGSCNRGGCDTCENKREENHQRVKFAKERSRFIR